MKFAKVTKLVIQSVFLICCAGNLYSQQIAFPGAEGYGKFAIGGRGGKVIQVTNLNDSGPGSLRDAIGQSGARTVVFLVSGTISMNSDTKITNPNITIAGQTAPGDGICLKNYKLVIDADDVVVRYLRFRRGRASGRDDDALAIQYAENVIVDHCSISWGCDETLNTWHGSKNITVQWCIVSEGLHYDNHGFAASLGGVNASYHHNLIANCPGRNPSIAGNNDHQTINLDFRNNVIFNFGYRTIDGKPTSVNIVNNYFKPGPNSTVKYFAKIDEPGVYEMIPTTAWYVSGNVWEGNATSTNDNHLGVTGAKEWLVNDPVPFSPVQTDSAEAAYQKVLADVGATLPQRDSVDLRIIEEATTGNTTYGKGVVLDPSDVGGWPTLESEPAPDDTDQDGMPDSWETGNDLNPNDPEDRNGVGVEGYTNLENYLNSLTEMPTHVESKKEKVPNEFAFAQNYPNPFNPSTNIDFSFPKKSKVKLEIFNITGKKVATLINEVKEAGNYSINFNGSNLSTGIYIYKLTTNNNTLARKMLLMK